MDTLPDGLQRERPSAAGIWSGRTRFGGISHTLPGHGLAFTGNPPDSIGGKPAAVWRAGVQIRTANVLCDRELTVNAQGLGLSRQAHLRPRQGY